MSKRASQPQVAYWVVDMRGGWGVGACRRGENGYHPVPEYGPYEKEADAQGLVDRLNARAGLTKRQVRSVVGSTMPKTASP